MATVGIEYRSIMSDLKKGIFKPIYYLMGDESFFIDSISDYIKDHVLSEEERDFNLITVYGLDTTMNDVIQRAKSYPMGAAYQVIIVREAQHLMKESAAAAGKSDSVTPLTILSSYLRNPQNSTILVFCHKNGTLDRRKKVASEIERVGVLFESKIVKNDALSDFITEFLSENHLTMKQKGISMMIESVGSDLCRMNGELEKLVTAIPAGTSEITPEFIEEHIGISKEYNVFEFKDAIVNKNIEKANKIAAYFESNSKKYPIQLITSTLFPFFANLMLAFYSPEKTEKGIADQLGLKNTWMVKDYITGMRNYTALQAMTVINDIRKYDAKSKGIDSTNGADGLLRELLFKIMH